MYEMVGRELIWRLSIALAIGLLIGLERGWQARGEAEGERAAGVRTHALTALLGGVWGAIVYPYGANGVIAIAVVFIAFSAVMAFFRLREIEHEHTFGATTIVALMLAFSLGAFAVIGEEFAAVAAAVATTTLLAFKSYLHGWLKRLTWPELQSALSLLVMSFILLPVLPNHAIDRWDAINPFELWLLTVLIGVIAFVGYVAVKIVGYRRGVAVAGMAGGLASSTAATAAMARLVDERPEQVNVLAVGALFANAVMAPRVMLLLGVINTDLAQRLAGPLVAIGVIYATSGVLLMRRGVSGDAPAESENVLTIENPLDFLAVLKFGAFLAVVMVLSRVASLFAGRVGVFALAAVSGVADVDPIALSMARHGADEIGMSAAAVAVLVALVSNTLSKTAMAAMIGGAGMGLRFGAVSLIALAAAAVALFAAPVVFAAPIFTLP